MQNIKNNMKFSIIIPALNESAWIEKTLTAVLDQTYKNFEVIVVNNNSTDNTARAVNDFITAHDAADRIRVIDCPTKGILHTRNAGLHAMTGDVLVQLDADSIVYPNWLARAAKHFENKKTVALAGAYDYYDAPFFLRYIGLFVEMITMPLGNWYVQKRKFGAFMIGGNAFIRKWVLDDMGGYDINHTFYSDDLVTARAVAKRGYLKFCFNLTVKSSARRHKQLGYRYVQSTYNKGTSAVLRGKPIPRQTEEYNHPR